MTRFRKSHFLGITLTLLVGCGTVNRDNSSNQAKITPLHHSPSGSKHVMTIGDSLTVGWIDWGVLSAGYRENLYKSLNPDGLPKNFDFVGYYNGIKTKNTGVPFVVDKIDNHNDGQNGDRIIDMKMRLTWPIPAERADSSGTYVSWYQETGVNIESDPANTDPKTSLIRECYLKKLSMLQCFKPDIVLLMAGSNDMPKTDHSTAHERLDELIGLILSQVNEPNSGKDVKIYVATLPPTAFSFINDRIRNYNTKVRNLVAYRRDKLLQNVHPVEISQSVTTKDLYKDGTHYTKTGYCKMANKWIDTMTEIPLVNNQKTFHPC